MTGSSFSPSGVQGPTGPSGPAGTTGATGPTGPGGGGAGMSRDITQTGHGLSVGNVIRFNGTNYVKAQADSAADAEVVGIVSAVADANNFTVTEGGYVTGLSGLTAGTTYFLDPSTAGALTATEPTVPTQLSKPLLIASSTTAGYFFNWRGALITEADANTTLLADQVTSSSTFTINGSSGAPNTLLTGNTFTLPVATDLTVEFQSAAVSAGSAALIIELFRDGVSLGRIAQINTASWSGPVHAEYKDTAVAAGSHQYVVKAWKNGGTDGTVDGGGGIYTPIIMRVTRANPLVVTSVPVGTLELVYRYTVTGSDKASIDTGVDTAEAGTGDWTNGDVLEVQAVIRTDDAAAGPSVDVTLNNDTGANYDLQVLTGSSTSASAGTALGTTAWSAVQVHGSGGTSGYAGALNMVFPGYARTVFNKTGIITSSVPDGTAGNNVSRHYSVGWRSTAAITRLKIAGQSGAKLKVGTQLLVYKRRSL